MTGAWPPVVLKWKFYYYLGRVKPGVRRCLPGKIVCYSQFPRGGGTDARQGRTGRPQGGWRQREGGSVWTRDLTEVSAGGVDKAGGQLRTGWSGSFPQAPGHRARPGLSGTDSLW